ncbi:hypothetical protein CcI49_22110 [Frankia sp. CcI49]|uniref:enoyl-CoA hydratase-related protein n=1 Tax=Frankia sp. CcI49 TaxID=1745382 RepID=UPI0009779CF7|nr:enoyl-CoA hydratase-related protein [Frankia sp. CcI49]ONH58203.1 hypothetical protein CcI49_22110 [Frankia sp. CcI49]
MPATGAFEDVRLDIDDPVAVVTIDRPASMNAFRGQTLRELHQAFTRAEHDRRVVGIVLTGAEQGVSWLLPRLVGPAHALDLLWSSRVVSAPEALAIGLAQRVVPSDRLLDECRAYIAELAAIASPHSMMVSKQLVYQHLQRDLGEAVDQTDGLMRESFRRPDPVEGATAFLERREPRFDRLDLLPPA